MTNEVALVFLTGVVSASHTLPTGAGCGIMGSMNVLISLVFGVVGAMFIVPFTVSRLIALRVQWLKVQGIRQQQQQAHSITVEESDSGGYQVVE
ncbi:MAG: hypothetical protein JO316_22595 [Abitibacteriaceae bacterium]|nr:hypothetical protein [Abditibacteriaceae bacterium]